MSTITVDDLVRREVICNVSSLFGDVLTLVQNADHQVLKSTSFDLEELMDLGQIPDYEAAGDEHIDSMDRDDLIEALSDADVEDERSAEEIAAAILGAREAELVRLKEWKPHLEWDMSDVDIEETSWPGISDVDLRAKLKDHLGEQDDGYKDFVSEHNLDYEYIEVYEHWVVSDWLARRLREHGECIGDISGLTVWGRTTTGQMISMDYVIQQIHRELVA